MLLVLFDSFSWLCRRKTLVKSSFIRETLQWAPRGYEERLCDENPRDHEQSYVHWPRHHHMKSSLDQHSANRICWWIFDWISFDWVKVSFQLFIIGSLSCSSTIPAIHSTLFLNREIWNSLLYRKGSISGPKYLGISIFSHKSLFQPHNVSKLLMLIKWSVSAISRLFLS